MLVASDKIFQDYRNIEYHKYVLAVVEILLGILNGVSKHDILESPSMQKWLEDKPKDYINKLEELYEIHCEYGADNLKQIIYDYIDSAKYSTRQELYAQLDLAKLIGFFAEYYTCNSVADLLAKNAMFARWLPQSVTYKGWETDENLYRLANITMQVLGRDVDSIVRAEISDDGYADSDMVILDHSNGQSGSTRKFGKKIGVALFNRTKWNRLSNNTEKVRKIIESDKIDSIIKLPRSMYDSITLVIYNRNKTRKNWIRIIDASSFVSVGRQYNRLDVNKFADIFRYIENEPVECIWVSADEVRDNDYNLIPEHYITSRMAIPEGYQLMPLRNLLCEIGEENVSTEEYGPLIESLDLSANPLAFTLGDEKPRWEQLKKRAFRYINEPALLVSRRKSLKPTYYSALCGGTYLSGFVYAYRIDTEKVSPQYLITELCKDYTLNQLFLGSPNPDFAEQFLTAKVLVPSRELQEQAAMSRLHSEQKNREDKLISLINLYTKEMGGRRHTLGHVVGNIDDTLSKIKTKLRRRNGTITLSDIKEQIEQFEFQFHRLKSLVDELTDDIKGWVEPDKIDIVEFIQDYQKLYPQKGYFLKVSYGNEKDEKYNVMFPKQYLLKVFENIFSNIKKHGFVEPARDDYHIYIECREEKMNDQSAIALYFMNNGNELPDTMTKEMVFKYGVTTGGTGIGGSQVRFAVQTYGGKIEFLVKNELPEPYNAGYKIIFPLI